MDDYCSSCKDVSQQLAAMLRRRRERRLPAEAPVKRGIFARFGTIKDICHRKRCLSCMDMMEEIRRWDADGYWTRRHDLTIAIDLDRRGGDESAFQVLYVVTEALDSQSKARHLVNFYPLASGGSHDYLGRLFDPHEFDIDLIKSWIQCCDLSHGELCQYSLLDHLPPETSPARILLIDLESQCLVFGTLAQKFVALSYVWGQTETLKTTQANLQELLEPGALKLSKHNSRIPKTLKDFMELAVQLEVRFAWVDCLCIIQDCQDLKEQLNGMAAIFSSTYLTIVAEGPDANFGILGLPNGPQKRNTRCPILRLPDLTCVFEDNAIPSNRTSPWDKRAWTFQEGLFSRRILFIDVAGFISWKCARDFWSETHKSPSEAQDWMTSYPEHASRDWRYLGFTDLNFEWPDMRRWCELAREYYGRELSFESDVLSAIAGLMSVLDKQSPGGFIWGLPELFFDTFLLWDMHGCTERKGSSELPSWSFLGWQGGSLDIFWWRFSMHYTFIDDLVDGFGSDCEVEPIVEWFKQNDSTRALVPIANNSHIHRSCSGDNVHQGWTRHLSKDTGSFYYTTGSNSKTRFRYPIPLRHEGVTLDKRHYSHLLHFKAQRCFLKIGSIITPSPVDESNYWREAVVSSLRDSAGIWMGAVRLLTFKSKNLTSRADLADLEGQRVELIAVAGGRVRNDAFPKPTNYWPGGWKIPEWNCEERRKDTELYEFYFVLSIEWHEGVAARTGLGRVAKVEWERLPLEVIDITLG